ncbi:LIM homeobox transcription factor 1-beta-like [Limulus polyphemus]|uniref:LIM homeobox transcription factor 1-beta-like n=1 Tax=Limulus polyphemus TaxID=6850 RepID=A0ABM1S532_LIMPO|nr:LIM homeobox transcription factor 1-beta-like [Limulus polyphemus]
MEPSDKREGYLKATGDTSAVRKSTGRKEHCTACRQPIVDRYIMRVMDNSWHEGCLLCSVCHNHLTKTCYSRDRKLYCKADYDKLFAAKCTGCLQPIAPSELVMRALDYVYHISCFTCVGCGRQLQKGDQFVIRNGRLYCRPDFEKEIAMIQLVQRNETAQLQEQHQNGQQRQDGRRGPKRPRTILTTAQRRAFKASFEISQKPCRKLKKMQRKQQQQQQKQEQHNSQKQQRTNQSNGGVAIEGNNSVKDGSPYSRLGSLTDSPPDGSQFSLPPVSYHASANEGQYFQGTADTYMKSEISLENEASLSGLEEVLIGQNQPPSLNDSSQLFSATINPIDKLYSMHSSYFSATDCECLGTNS